MEPALSLTSVVVATREQVSSDLAGEAAILNLESGVYYGLDVVGARIWNLIQTPHTVGSVRDALLEEYDVSADCCEGDLLELLTELAAARLIEVGNALPR